MKKFLLIFLMLQMSVLQSQENHYYYNDKNIMLNLNMNNINILIDENFDLNSIPSVDSDNTKQIVRDTVNKTMWYHIKLTNVNQSEYYSIVNLLKNDNQVYHIAYYYDRQNYNPIGTSNIFYVRLKNINDYSILENLCNTNNLEILSQVPYMPLWYKIRINNKANTSIGMANIFYETGNFSKIDVGFTFDFSTEIVTGVDTTTNSSQCNLNDPEFYRQWGLDNAVNPSIDINACDAWGLSEGNDIKVAVIDTGILRTHPDLDDNIYSIGYDSFLDQVNDITNYPDHRLGMHGTAMATTIGSEKNNNLKFVGIAPGVTMIDASFADQPQQQAFPNRGEAFAACISFAYQNNADVINCSWGDAGGQLADVHSPLLEDAINNALTNGRNGLGSVVVFGSGNQSTINYPPNTIDEVICVGGVNENGARFDYGTVESAFGDRLDIVAPGDNIPYIRAYSWWLPPTDVGTGTSFSCAYTSGVAALILSLNPCLTQQQVKQIIEESAQKIRTDLYTYDNFATRPNGTWNSEMGYGLLDAYQALLLAQQIPVRDVDFVIKDSSEDLGYEPNNDTQFFWNSPDIWIRNIDDGGLQHQNPEYDPNNPVYVYVRIKNQGCVTSSGQDKIYLHWATGHSGNTWPDPWTGNNISVTPINYPYLIDGGYIGSITIPSIAPQSEAIIKIPWNIPAIGPILSGNGDYWRYSILARIVTSSDPMTIPETSNLTQNIKNNNNIALKSVAVVDILPNTTNNQLNNLVVFAINNPFDNMHDFNIELINNNDETGKPIYVESEVKIKMDDILYAAWERGGKIIEEMENTNEEKEKIVKDNHALIKNINFNPKEAGLLTLDFSFLTEEITDKDTYVYHLIQKDASTNEVIGGGTIIIHKPIRPVFTAEADDQIADIDEVITISAQQINEAAIYNWYDMQGNLIYQGEDLTITADVAKKIKLEVVATADGFKDYKDVEVKMKPNRITQISPNPASDIVHVEYKINDNISSYIMVIGTYGGSNTINNYIIDINNNQVDINLTDYPQGYYTIALVTNGQIVDTKSILIN